MLYYNLLHLYFIYIDAPSNVRKRKLGVEPGYHKKTFEFLCAYQQFHILSLYGLGKQPFVDRARKSKL